MTKSEKKPGRLTAHVGPAKVMRLAHTDLSITDSSINHCGTAWLGHVRQGRPNECVLNASFFLGCDMQGTYFLGWKMLSVRIHAISNKLIGISARKKPRTEGRGISEQKLKTHII